MVEISVDRALFCMCVFTISTKRWKYFGGQKSNNVRMNKFHCSIFLFEICFCCCYCYRINENIVPMVRTGLHSNCMRIRMENHWKNENKSYILLLLIYAFRTKSINSLRLFIKPHQIVSILCRWIYGLSKWNGQCVCMAYSYLCIINLMACVC